MHPSNITFRPALARLTAILVVCFCLTLLTACSRADVPTQIATARADIAAGKLGEAFVTLKNVAQSNPDNAEVRVLLAQIALAQGNSRAADEELSRVALEKIPDAGGQMTKLRVELAAGRTDAVLKALDGSKLDKDQQKFLRALVLRRNGDDAQAIGLLTELAANKPDNVEYGTELILAIAAQGDVESGHSKLEAYRKIYPRDPDLLVLKALLDLASGQVATALAALQQAVASEQKDWAPAKRAQAYYMLGDTALRTRDIKVAKSALASLDKVAPGMVGATLLKARIAMTENRLAEAVDDLQKVARAAPSDQTVAMLLAEAHLQSRNMAQAQAVLEQIVAVAPGNLQARKTLARLLLSQNRPDKVVDLIEEVPAEQVADVELRDIQSLARSIQVRATQTIENLQAQLGREPANHRARLGLAQAQVSSGLASEALLTLSKLPADFEPASHLRIKLLALVAQSNRRELEREIDRIAALKPVQVDQLLTAADVTAVIGRSDLAMRVLDAALAAVPNNSRVALSRAAVMLVDRRPEDARKELAKLLQRDPKNIAAHLAMARIEISAGDVDAARKAVLEARRLDPQSIDAATLLAGLELRAGRVPNAVGVMQEMVQMAKADGVAAAAAGQALARVRRYAEAVPFLRQATQQRNNPADTINLAQVLSQTGKADEARSLLQQLVRVQPDNPDAVVALASLETSAGQSQQAIQRLNSLAGNSKARIDAVVALADAQLAQGRALEAIANYEKAYRSAPSAGLALRMFGARTRGKMNDPEQPLKAWLARDPSDIVVRLALGDHYIRVNNSAAARATYEEIVQAQPNQPVALNNLAWLLSGSDPARAEELARKAVQLQPNQPQIAETLASVLARQGKYTDALPYFAASVDAMSNDGGVLYRYADALNRTGDKPAAKAMAARALAAPGSFPERQAAAALAAELK